MHRICTSIMFILIFAIVLIFSPLTALAADTVIDLETITHGTSGAGYSYSFGILLLTGSGPFVITTNGNTVTDRAIAFSPGMTASVTLNNAKIDVSSIWDVCAFDMTGATVDLTLTGTNTLKSGDNRAGLEVPTGAELTVTAQSTGTLTATGGTAGAGVGGGYQADCGNVAIYGGTVIAVGTHSEDSEYDGGGAGIGGGGHGSALSGHGGNGGTIVINGGTVSATGGACAAGIGGGSAWDSGGNTGSVIIQSGTVTATGTYGGAGIGGGWRGGGGSIIVAGGDVTANGSGSEHPIFGECGGAGLGSGTYAADAGNIVITGGTITANGGGNAAGIGHGFFYSGTASGSVRIEDGDITAVGGSAGAGIGGGMENGDTLVTISGGRIDATGGLGGAGIGGGFGGNGGTIVITGGDITATGAGGMHPTRGDAYGSGIGAGTGAQTGTITISGGDVKASGASGGAGIGGRGGSIEISGGTVTVIGGNHEEYYSSGGAGIGGTGFYGGNNAISISGGTVYAQRGADAQHDIGYGTGGTGMTLRISGSAAVLLQTDSCLAPVTTTHTHETFSSGTTLAYGIAVPPAWSSGFGAYLRLVTLSYDLNSGTGTVPPVVTRNYLSAITASDGSGITRDCYQLSGWNTAADGSGSACALGGTVTITGDTTLYAQWMPQPELSSSVSGAKIFTGGRITLTPNIEGGTWDWDETFFTATFNSPATFTALKAGASTITYTVGGVVTTYEVTIEASALPGTGQNFAWVWVLCGAALVTAAAASILRKHRGKNRA